MVPACGAMEIQFKANIDHRIPQDAGRRGLGMASMKRLAALHNSIPGCEYLALLKVFE